MFKKRLCTLIFQHIFASQLKEKPVIVDQEKWQSGRMRQS